MEIDVPHIHLIMGFSTGHCGTTTLSDKNSYQVIDKHHTAKFLFETNYVDKKQYRNPNFDLQSEIDHVESHYGPKIIQEMRLLVGASPKPTHITIVDLSHSNLFFHRGLVFMAMKLRHKFNISFIRIRRDRYETARSMASESCCNHGGFFNFDFFRYHPFENEPNVILKVNRDIWNNMTLLEQIFWVGNGITMVILVI